MSYFNIYFNLRFERTLRRYSRPVNLARFDRRHWMTTTKPIWFIAEYLCEIPHIRLADSGDGKTSYPGGSAHNQGRDGRAQKETGARKTKSSLGCRTGSCGQRLFLQQQRCPHRGLIGHREVPSKERL